MDCEPKEEKTMKRKSDITYKYVVLTKKTIEFIIGHEGKTMNFLQQVTIPVLPN